MRSTGSGRWWHQTPAVGVPKLVLILSAVIIRRNDEGVILRYDIEPRRAFHDERKPQVSDSRRNALVTAERELLTMAVIFDHLDLSGIARTRLDDGLRRIRRALNARRVECDMAEVAA
jgi:hypothetical protein